MIIDFFNSATVRAPALLMCRAAGWRRVDVPVRYGIVRQADGRIHLVDTGYGPRVTVGRRSASLRLYSSVLRPRLIEDASPRAALAKLGATPDDVASVIVTHFHADHVARLDEFPQARIVAHGAAAGAVQAASERAAIRHGIFKELLPADIMARLEPIEDRPLAEAHPILGRGRDLFGDGALLAIDLPGHANGHFGLFWRDGAGEHIYATDTAWSRRALLEDRTPAVSRRVVFDDPDAGRRTERMVRDFARAGGQVHLCHEWEAR